MSEHTPEKGALTREERGWIDGWAARCDADPTLMRHEGYVEMFENILAARLNAAGAPVSHGVAWENRLNIICLCGQVCTAVFGKSPARIIGSTGDTYVAQPAAQAFAQHLLDVRIPPEQRADQ